MKKLLVRLLKSLYGRNQILRFIFSDWERTAIINALYRRSEDLSTDNVAADKGLRFTCEQIAKEMMH